MVRLINDLESENVIKHEIVKGFPFAIRVDIVGKAVRFFETCRYLLTNVDYEKCLNVIQEGYWASISGGSLWDEGDGVFLWY